MKWKAALWNGLGVLMSLLLVKNACNFWGAYAHSWSMDSNYILWVNLIGTAIGLILLSAIVGNLFRAPFAVSVARISAFFLALFMPSYGWPEQEWKIEVNADRYNGMISRVETKPKIAILDRHESALSINGIIVTYLVYDESDRIGMPEEFRPKEWRSTIQRTPLSVSGGGCRITVTKVRPHFFYIIQDCT